MQTFMDIAIMGNDLIDTGKIIECLADYINIHANIEHVYIPFKCINNVTLIDMVRDHYIMFTHADLVIVSDGYYHRVMKNKADLLPNNVLNGEYHLE